MARKQKVERNDLIVKMYKPGKMGYKKLAKKFGIHYSTVKEIIEKYGKKS